MLEAETVEVSPGQWLSRVSYPELPGCISESPVVEEALARLERLRIETIIAILGAGRRPPVPRPPLLHCDPVWLAEQTGLNDEIVARIKRDEAAAVDETTHEF
jgi:hypothetical protein